jgi:hypothetical protein
VHVPDAQSACDEQTTAWPGAHVAAHDVAPPLPPTQHDSPGAQALGPLHALAAPPLQPAFASHAIL